MPFSTTHRILLGNSQQMLGIEDESVDLVVTSPPYPMISMWDSTFSKLNKDIATHLEEGEGMKAFELMHEQLDRTWKEVYRVTRPGGIACINIGDATRKVGEDFCLYPSHSRITEYFIKLGFKMLPGIIWRKQTNAPNKFMGSGMLPVGAYVTLEHEHILIFRKGPRRQFENLEDLKRRGKSAFFWEERNKWFSDLWDGLKGTRQNMGQKAERARNAAFPLEVPFRLISMYSVLGDTILDPFLGIGTSMVASVITGRNSIGYEIEKDLMLLAANNISNSVKISDFTLNQRLVAHNSFVKDHIDSGKALTHYNKELKTSVKHRSEMEIEFFKVKGIYQEKDGLQFKAEYDVK